jgi:CDGSH iron-sulfur domain-containing protein 3
MGQGFRRALAEPEGLGLGVGCQSQQDGAVATLNDAIVAQKGAFAVELRCGRTYVWCGCGHSVRQPFCDGSHAGLVPVVFEAERDGAAYPCGCKTSRDRSLCDDSHNQL